MHAALAEQYRQQIATADSVEALATLDHTLRSRSDRDGDVVRGLIEQIETRANGWVREALDRAAREGRFEEIQRAVSAKSGSPMEFGLCHALAVPAFAAMVRDAEAWERAAREAEVRAEAARQARRVTELQGSLQRVLGGVRMAVVRLGRLTLDEATDAHREARALLVPTLDLLAIDAPGIDTVAGIEATIRSVAGTVDRARVLVANTPANGAYGHSGTVRDVLAGLGEAWSHVPHYLTTLAPVAAPAPVAETVVPQGPSIRERISAVTGSIMHAYGRAEAARRDADRVQSTADRILTQVIRPEALDAMEHEVPGLRAALAQLATTLAAQRPR